MRLLDFAKVVDQDYEADWFHSLIAGELEKVVTEGRDLIVATPPGLGKTALVSILFPAWALAHDPGLHTIAISNSDPLARMVSGNVLRLVNLPEFRERWPMELASENESRWRVEGNDGRPSFMCFGVSGAATGNRADLLLIDDPIKSQSQAFSENERNRIFNDLMSAGFTRLLPNGRVCLVATRWHDDDPSGRLISAALANKRARQWTYIKLAAFNDDGERSFVLDTRTGEKKYFDPYKSICRKEGRKYSFSREAFEEKRADLGPSRWSALYQQEPMDADSQLFPPECWRWYDGLNQDELELVVSSWDFASKTGSRNDYSANVELARTSDGRIVVLDVFKTKSDFSQMPGIVLARWQSLAAKHKCIPALVVEDANAGTQVIQLFQASQQHIPLVPVKPTKSKVLRAEGVTPVTRGGVVALPRGAEWVESFVSELANFPVGTHDDVVDAFVHGLKGFLTDGDFKATKFLLPPQMNTVEGIAREAVREMTEEPCWGLISPDLDEVDRKGGW